MCNQVRKSFQFSSNSPHLKPTRHLQFNSPTAGQGNPMLATHSKGLTRVWRLSENAPSGSWEHIKGIGTTKWGSVCRQYAWDPDGPRILTRWDGTTRVQPAVSAPVPH